MDWKNRKGKKKVLFLGGIAQQQPFLETPAGIAVLVVAVCLILIIAALIVAWWFKSRRRKKEFFERKNSLRASLRSNRIAQEMSKQEERLKEIEKQHQPSAPIRPPSVFQLPFAIYSIL